MIHYIPSYRHNDHMLIIEGGPTPLLISLDPELPLSACEVIVNNLENMFHVAESAKADELARIKTGIKRCEITMIVDGNDMCDWGWTTQECVNRRRHLESSTKELTPSPNTWLAPQDSSVGCQHCGQVLTKHIGQIHCPTT